MTKELEIYMSNGDKHIIRIPEEKAKSWLDYNFPCRGLWQIDEKLFINSINIIHIKELG